MQITKMGIRFQGAIGTSSLALRIAFRNPRGAAGPAECAGVFVPGRVWLSSSARERPGMRRSRRLRRWRRWRGQRRRRRRGRRRRRWRPSARERRRRRRRGGGRARAAAAAATDASANSPRAMRRGAISAPCLLVPRSRGAMELLYWVGEGRALLRARRIARACLGSWLGLSREGAGSYLRGRRRLARLLVARWYLGCPFRRVVLHCAKQVLRAWFLELQASRCARGLGPSPRVRRKNLAFLSGARSGASSSSD